MSTKPVRSKTVILRLSPKTLVAFPHEPAAAPTPEPKPASSPDTPAPQAADSSVNTPADSSTMNGTNTPSSLAPPAVGPNGKRKGPAPKKRTIAAVDGANGTNGTPKARGKPGPKSKKQKLGDMINDPNSTTPFAAPTPAQKLGPKANAGAINANLRSLDRTGKFKCRKWQKTGFRLRTFTGSVVELPSWKAPQRSSAFSEDVKSDSTGSSDSKIKDESSAISEKSGLTPAPRALDALASSPAPVPTAS
ncbi:INO80 complex, subunit Ies4 [Paraphoma chrysanthemicola]|uniref:INO80 complex, subunit Ies4 n=1 Tax=Paraphoma chrysanthemicola TaxID=798071 RepID=A0A8K0R615_9PLEO|nr:INO80 complex, subunit Ies4 [Paraphoma chrysanthemicola]